MSAPITWAALLRGVNVGNSRRIAMVELRDLFAKFGYVNVRTLLNSGNVLFEAPVAAAHDAPVVLQAAIAARFGVSPRVYVRAVAVLQDIIAANPLAGAADDPAKLVVALYEGAPTHDRLARLARRDWSPERLAVTAQAAYLWCPDGLSGGKLGDAVFHAVGEHGTTRNFATLTKLVTLAAA